MSKQSVEKTIKQYLNELIILGVPVKFGVLFGSHTREKDTHSWSDIDLLIISSRYDKPYSREDINLLWRTAARIDSRIEPIAVGLLRWEKDDESTIIEIARREGIRLSV